MTRGELARRIAVAAVGIPLAAYLLTVGGWPLALGLAFFAALATLELFALTRSRGVRPFTWVGVMGSVAMVGVAGGTRSFAEGAPWALGILVAVFLICSILSVARGKPDGHPLFSVSLTLLGVVLGGCFSFALYVRHLPGAMPGTALPPGLAGPMMLAFPLAVTWIGDSAAYFGGHLFGDRKLLPSVSPGKTVVGSVAGLSAALLVGAATGAWLLEFHPHRLTSVAVGAVLGFLLGAGAQLGDLAESVIKREAGVKDSGRVLPGHGGALDRFDALIFNFPLAYGLLLLTEWLR